MIRRGTWIAIFLFAIVLAGAMYWNRTSENNVTAPTTVPAPEPIWTIAAESVESFQVQRFDDGIVVAGRRDSEHGWVLTRPEDGPAQAGLVEQGVTSLLSPVPARVLQASALSPFGLHDPDFQVTLRVQSGEEFQLLVGDLAPAGTGYYVMISDDEAVYLLRTFVLDTILGFLDNSPVAESTPTAEPAESATPTSQDGG